MATITFPNNQGVFIGPMTGLPVGGTAATSSVTINAAGESAATIGRVIIAGGGSKTISAAGGGVLYIASFNSITFANAGTNLRIGIQDVGAAGLEDGTFDVYADLVGGTDTIAILETITVPMETGTKTITSGDEVAIVVEMTALGGADSLAVQAEALASLYYPYGTSDTGTLTKSVSPKLSPGIRFDDGTIGWIEGIIPARLSSVSLGTGTNPDEVGLYFVPPATMTTDTFFAVVGGVATTDTFELCVYEDPTGTPVEIIAIVFDPNKIASTAAASGGVCIHSPTEVTFLKDTPYVISVKPTSGNQLSVSRFDFNTGNSGLRVSTMLGTSWAEGRRIDETGAFLLTDTRLPLIGFFVSEIEAGGGGAFGFS